MESKPQFTNGPEHEPKNKLDQTPFVPYRDTPGLVETMMRERFRVEIEAAGYISQKLDRSFESCLKYLQNRRLFRDYETIFWIGCEGQIYYKNEHVDRYIRREKRKQRASLRAFKEKMMWAKEKQNGN